jgi:hypothetical protein
LKATLALAPPRWATATNALARQRAGFPSSSSSGTRPLKFQNTKSSPVWATICVLPVTMSWTKRGRRLDETTAGAGFGLAIALDLAQLYRGSLELTRSDLGGLCATLDLPAPS